MVKIVACRAKYGKSVYLYKSLEMIVAELVSVNLEVKELFMTYVTR